MRSAADTESSTLRAAFALALGAAVSLGLARFSYALLLPAMRADLRWSYFTAGALNTSNAVGYLVGALAMPALLSRFDVRRVLLAGGLSTAIALGAHGAVRGESGLYLLRAIAGVASAAMFVSGGLLAARLGQRPGAKPTLVLGLYYGGTGVGIVLSALLVPPLPWPGAWGALATAATLCTAWMAHGTRDLDGAPAARIPAGRGFRAIDFGWGLAGYLMFGLGYIGYMTFNVTLLREQGAGGGVVTAFYTLLGLGVLASSWLWAPVLQRWRDGRALALLNGLLALATMLPVLDAHPATAFVSGALFGAVFLSVVASTTALVRHNLPPELWSAGISRFTVVFAAGQIIGPSVVGWLADGSGGLRQGLAVSSGLLAVGSLLALRQRALDSGSP